MMKKEEPKRELKGLNVSKGNSMDFHDFLSEHLEDPYTQEDLMNVIKTINPANGKFKSASKLSRAKSKTDVIFQGQMLFDFPDEKSAKLFKSVKEKLQQNTEGPTFNVLSKGTKVRLDTDPQDAYYLSHRLRDEISPENQERVDKAFQKREENRMLCDNMLLVTSTLLDSQLYRHNEKPIFKMSPKIDSKEKYDHYALKLKDGNAVSTYRYAVMEQNAIPKNLEFEQEVLQEVKSAMRTHLDKNAGQYMIQNLFKVDDSNSIHRSIDQKNELTREYANKPGDITPQSLQKDGSFLQRTAKKVQEMKSSAAELLSLSTPEVEQEPKPDPLKQRFDSIRYR